MRIAIRGRRSAIARALEPLLPRLEEVIEVRREDAPPADAVRYLFCAGVMAGVAAKAQDDAAMGQAFSINCGRVLKACDWLIQYNDHARICVIGSESALAGSFDGVYAATKAGLHSYVKTKRLRTPQQQLVCVAPGIIDDAGMTTRRLDVDNLERRRKAHPKGRFIKAVEVARLVHFLLYVDAGYITNTVIRMNGGSHIR